MVVVPCSMKTLAGIAHGLSRNLVERAADVMLKERRTLIIVPRETPMSLPQLRNMVLCAEAGAMIMPAMPAFYQMPKTLDDLADFMAGKILSALGFAHELYPPWRELKSMPCAWNMLDGPAGLDKTPARIAGMFDAIAPRYDLLNHVLSAGLDRRWRAAGGRDAARFAPGARVLDLCTGTARSGDRGRRRQPSARRSSASTSRARCCGSGVARSRRSASSRSDPAGPRRRHADPARRRVVRRGDDRLRHPQRRRTGAGARRARPRAEARRPARDPRVRPAAHPRDPDALRLVFPLPAAARRPAGLEAPERLLVPAGLGRHLSVRRRSSPNISKATGFSQVRAVPLTFGIVYLYVGAQKR